LLYQWQRCLFQDPGGNALLDSCQRAVPAHAGAAKTAVCKRDRADGYHHEWRYAKLQWDIREVQAFQTRDGIFAFNEAAGQFEPGVTYFRFNKSSQQMERVDANQDTYLAQDAQVLGPTNSARALLSVGPTGEWCVGLPLPASRSPQALPAYHFKEIVTSKGVYAYDDQKQDFVYKSHTQFAQEAKEATDKYWEEWRKKNWDRRVQEYQLGTERLKALAPLFWRPWSWW